MKHQMCPDSPGPRGTMFHNANANPDRHYKNIPVFRLLVIHQNLRHIKFSQKRLKHHLT